MSAPDEPFIRRVMAIAAEYGVLAFHDWDSRKNTAGLPDLILVGSHRVEWWEIKKDQWSTFKTAQVTWRYKLKGAGQTYRVVYYRDIESGQVEDLIAALNFPLAS